MHKGTLESTSEDLSEHRHVLLIAYYYPPVQNSGTKRVVKFATYLPEHGYQPVVLTTRGRGELPDDAANHISRIDDLAGLIKRPYRNWKLRSLAPDQRANVPALGPESRIERWRSALSIPDHQIIWYPFAVWLGHSLLRSHPIRLIFSTSPPETTHLIAWTLKKRTGLPWVADFRDGWMFDPLIPTRATSPLRNRIETWLERGVVKNADAVVTVNKVIGDDFAQRYPDHAHKINVIPNGYDPADFATIQRQRGHGPAQEARFRVVYTGTFSTGRRSIDALITALQRLKQEQRPIATHIELLIAGNLTATEQSVIESATIADMVTTVGIVPYHESLQHQVDADVLLLLVPPGAVSSTTTKLFEYLATGRPILALSAQSAAADLIRELDAGVVVPPEDPHTIAHACEQLYEQWKAGDLPTRADERVRRYDRRALTGELGALFDRMSV